MDAADVCMYMYAYIVCMLVILLLLLLLLLLYIKGLVKQTVSTTKQNA